MSQSIALLQLGAAPAPPVTLAPYFLARQAAFAYAALRDLSLERTVGALDAVAALERERDRAAEALCAAIYAAVPTVSPAERRQLLVAQRAVYNARLLDEEQAVALAGRLGKGASLTALATWQRCQREIHAANERLRRLFADELAERRRAFAHRLRDPDLLRGIQLSQPQLYESAERYIAAIDGSGELPQRQRKAEVTLISYVTRMALKPTPFGSFTRIARGRLDEVPAAVADAPLHRVVRVSRLLLVWAEQALAAMAPLKPHSIVRLTNTCRIVDGTLHLFARGRDGTVEMFTRETFRTLALGDGLALVVRLLQEGPQRRGALVAALVAGGARAHDADAFIERLLELGVVASGFGIADQEPDFVGALLERLRALPDGVADPVAPHVAALADVERRFGEADAAARVSLDATLRSELATLATVSGAEPPGVEHMRSLFYEDVAVGGPPRIASRDELRRFEEPFDLMRRLLPLFSEAAVEQMAFHRLFVELYGDAGARPSVLELYRRFSAVPKEELARRNRFDLFPEAMRMRTLQERLFSHLADEQAARPDADELPLAADLVRDLCDAAPAPVRPWESIGVRCQRLGDGRAVLTGVGVGFGKQYSRFCHLFAHDGRDALHDEIRRAGAAYPSDRIYADLVAVLGLNVNLHPSLLPAEVLYPGSQPTGDAETITLDDLVVVADGEQQRLMLWSRRHDRPVVLVPLNFLFPLAAPPLYRFLCRFGPSAGSQISLWDRYNAWLPAAARAGVRRHPRLLLGPLVIERNTWKVPATALPPPRSEKQADFERFVELRRWSRALALPERAFYRARTLPDPFAQYDEGWEERAPAWLQKMRNPRERKPNYVDFRDWLTLKALDRHLRELDDELTVQECLPDVHGGANGSRDEHATELVLEATAFEGVDP